MKVKWGGRPLQFTFYHFAILERERVLERESEEFHKNLKDFQRNL